MKKYNGWNDNKSVAGGVGGKPGPFEEQPEQERGSDNSRENIILIFDTITKWVNDRERETIPRKAFLEIAKEVYDKVFAAAQPSKVQEKEILELNHAIVIKVEQLAAKEKEIEELKKENELLEAREVAWQNKHSFLMDEIQRLKGLIDIAYSTGKYAGHHLSGSEEERISRTI